MIPTIETERLVLTAPSLECLQVYEQFYADSLASKAYGPMSNSEVWTRLKADLGSWYLLGFGVWVIQLKESKDFVGTCGFWQGKGWPTELTWWLLPFARGKGLAYEASVAAVSHAYDIFDWDTVETYMDDQNIPAHALVKKLGGIKDRRIALPDGVERDVYVIPPKTRL